MGALPPVLAEWLTVTGYRVGWGLVRRLPGPAAYRIFDRLADLSYRRGGKSVARLRANYARVRPELGPDELEELVREGMRSYLRYWCDAFRLPDWTKEDLGRRVSLRGPGAQLLRETLASRGRAVVFTGHAGNWDSSAAWAAYFLAPVTTVAERLKPEKVFDAFMEYRAQIGIRILPLTGGPPPFPGLRQAVQRGDFVALVADRDLTDNGVEVDFVGSRARMAKGPAVLAVMERATLFPASMHYLEPSGEDPGFGGRHCVIHICDPVPMPETGDTASKVAALTQGCADAFGEQIRLHTEDWHMMQRVFVEDLR